MRTNRINPSHLRPEPFFVDGVERGAHYVEMSDGAGEGYVVTADLGSVPSLLIRSRGAVGRLPPRGPGVQQRLSSSSPALDKQLIAFSPGDGFPAALCRSPETTALLCSGFVDVIDILPGHPGSRLICRTVGDPRLCLDLAVHLVTAADDLAGRGIAFPDASLARIGVHSDAEPSPERVEKLAAHLMEVTHWLTGHAARVGDAVEAHVVLNETGHELAGVLRLAWRDAEARVVDASLDGALALKTSGTLSLVPQKGVWARIRAFTELRIGDAEVDSAYLVDGDPRHAPIALAARDMLVSLAADDARVEIDAQAVRVRVPPRARSFVEIHQLAESLLLLWRRAAIVRAGHAVLETPESSSS